MILHSGISQVGANEFCCGHYDLDVDDSRPGQKVVWRNNRNRGSISIWTRRGKNSGGGESWKGGIIVSVVVALPRRSLWILGIMLPQCHTLSSTSPTPPSRMIANMFDGNVLKPHLAHISDAVV